ncbi:MAG: hypothetical protein AB2705_09280 [Candidatus Thiodiazotropha sp.]
MLRVSRAEITDRALQAADLALVDAGLRTMAPGRGRCHAGSPICLESRS